MILSFPLLTQAVSVLALLAYGLALVWPSQSASAERPTSGRTRSDQILWGLVSAGWLLQGLLLSWGVIDWDARPVAGRFGFALALSVTVWVVLGIYAFERVELDATHTRRALALLAMLCIGLMQVFPGQRHEGGHPALAPLHWVLGLASYGLFGAALLHAAFWQISERRLRNRVRAVAPAGSRQGIPLLKLESLTLRFVAAGFAVLSATLVLGVVFAHPWRWDHKSVFSVMAWCLFAVLLMGRRLRGWRGKQVIAWLYAGSLLLLLGYAGSRFVLEVLLKRPPALS